MEKELKENSLLRGTLETLKKFCVEGELSAEITINKHLGYSSGFKISSIKPVSKKMLYESKASFYNPDKNDPVINIDLRTIQPEEKSNDWYLPTIRDIHKIPVPAHLQQRAELIYLTKEETECRHSTFNPLNVETLCKSLEVMFKYFESIYKIQFEVYLTNYEGVEPGEELRFHILTSIRVGKEWEYTTPVIHLTSRYCVSHTIQDISCLFIHTVKNSIQTIIERNGEKVLLEMLHIERSRGEKE